MICNKCKTDISLAGQGFRDWVCVYCGKTFTHHNTNIPRYCPKCSELLGLCEQCGEPLEDIETHNCRDCENRNWDEDWEGNITERCYCNHDYVNDCWTYNFNCPDFKKK